MTDRTYGTRLPGMPKESPKGKLIVIEGADGSGRTTEVALLRGWLEIEGHAVVDTGLRRSDLVSSEIDRAKQGHTLAATTMALLYAADFADQLENKIVPALSAGSTVLAAARPRGLPRRPARDPPPPVDRKVRLARLLGVGDGPLPLPGPLRELLPLPGALIAGVRVDVDRVRLPRRRCEPRPGAGARGSATLGGPALRSSVRRGATPAGRASALGQSCSAASCFRVSSQTSRPAPGRTEFENSRQTAPPFVRCTTDSPSPVRASPTNSARVGSCPTRSTVSCARAERRMRSKIGVERFPGASSSQVSGAGAASSSRRISSAVRTARPAALVARRSAERTTLARPRAARRVSASPLRVNGRWSSSGQRAGSRTSAGPCRTAMTRMFLDRPFFFGTGKWGVRRQASG